MILGRSLDYWCDLDAVLQIHGINGPRDLNTRLDELRMATRWNMFKIKPVVPPCSFCENGKSNLQVFKDNGPVMHHIDADFCPKCGRKLLKE